MLTRVVKMSFHPEHAEKFRAIFHARKHLIEAFEGCQQVQLFQDMNDMGVFMTISHWDQESSLEAYRYSTLFKQTWDQVKPLFRARAEARSFIDA